MEEKILRYILRLNSDKVRLTELIAYFTHDVPGSEKENIIFKKILPALLNMEKDRKIVLSWDIMLTRYRFPRYIYFRSIGSNTDKKEGEKKPLWQRQIEDILKRKAASYNKKLTETRLQDKFERFIKRYEKSAAEISPSDDWIGVITAIIESNLSQYDVMRACIESFKAGAIWERYKDELDR